MKRIESRIEPHIDTSSRLVFSVGNVDRRLDMSIATPEDIATKRRIDLRRVSAYTHREWTFLPRRVARFREKHSDDAPKNTP